jgi:hypothetical protein
MSTRDRREDDRDENHDHSSERTFGSKINFNFKDIIAAATIIVGVAFAYGDLRSKVESQADAIKAVPQLALEVGRLSERVEGLKEAVVDLKRAYKKGP